MSRVPWKHTSPIEPFCALMTPHGEITWYLPCTRAPFNGPSETTPLIAAVPFRLSCLTNTCAVNWCAPPIEVVQGLDPGRWRSSACS